MWNTAPGIGAQVAVFTGAAEEDNWKQTGVKPAVTANGFVDFYIITGSTDGVDYNSSEADTHRPTLVVSWSVPSGSASPTHTAYAFAHTGPDTRADDRANGGSPTPTGAPGPTTGPTPGVCSTCITYYVDSVSGNDANNGRSEAAPWRSLSKAGSASLAPGDRVLFKRGASWSGPLTLSQTGTAERPIIFGSYGSGALPIIQGPSDCITVKGSRVIVTQLHVDNCEWGGIRLASGATFNRIDGNLITRNVAGVFVSSGSTDNTIVANTIRDNNKMSVNTPGGDDDSGAFGVLLNGDRNDVAKNTISGSDAHSFDYVRDGAAVEVYGGLGNHVHHNLAFENDAFTELGNSRSRDNTFAYNIFRSSLERSIFLVTRGGSSGYGPVANTKLLNNTVYLTGASSQGFVCHAGCNGSVLSMRNNIIQAVLKAGYADGAFDEDYNVYSGQVQFSTRISTR